MFKTQRIKQFLEGLGYKQQFNQALRSWLSTKGRTEHIDEALNRQLASYGYVGSYPWKQRLWAMQDDFFIVTNDNQNVTNEGEIVVNDPTI